MVELTPELIKDLSKTRNGFYSWDYVAGLAFWIIGVEAENDKLVEALQSMFDACMKADEQGELSELISGELLDSVGKLLGYTPENAIKKEREYLEAIKQDLKEVKE